MAAIIEPRFVPATARPARPVLQVVPDRGSRPVSAPAPITGSQVATVLVAVALALLVVVGSVAIGRGALAGLAPSGPTGVAGVASGPTATVQVQVGDTMWSIARDLRPTGDVRPLVDELVRLNGSSTIHPGQELVVPAG